MNSPNLYVIIKNRAKLSRISNYSYTKYTSALLTSSQMRLIIKNMIGGKHVTKNDLSL